MSKKVVLSDPFQPKITRNDRFAQMSHQEKVIEQKKKEIQAKLDAKQKTAEKVASQAKREKSPPKKIDLKKAGFNLFSNDGSFLDTFKQLKKKPDSKVKSLRKDSFSEQRSMVKNSRWQRQRSPSPKDRPLKPRISRFSDKSSNFESKITITKSFSNQIVQQNFEANTQISISPQNVTGQPLLKNILQNSAPVIAAPPLLLNVPPPQIVQSQSINSTLILNDTSNSVLVSAPTVNVTIPASGVLATVTLPPPSIVPPVPPPSVELSTIPPPSPIQVQNIPQPEPINALNIPPPAPIQVQNIPTPSTIQLSEIPNPKPIDLLAIPTPNEDKSISDPDFIKNIPPPNKSVPPPSTVNILPVSIPPPTAQNIIVTIPPPQQIQTSNLTGVPPPSNFIPLAAVTTNTIPSLMAQPILPPPGMTVTTVNVNCPPPMLSLNQPPPPPSFVNQPPPMTNQMPPMNVPPPTTAMVPFRDMTAVFPPGTPEYETMASLGRMVAQCGPSVEDVVRQRKTQDPSLWFLFHKESAAYQQYQQLVERFKREVQDEYKPEDIYEPDDDVKDSNSPKRVDDSFGAKRKRKSRWGDKDFSVPPPTVVLATPPGGVMLSRVTKTDPALIQYAITTFGSANLSQEEWKKAEDHYKINLLYQDMIKKREELEKLQRQGRNKYDYDSDEDIEGGTWEHKLRDKEMMATQRWAEELNRQAEGKHHIGDFLPPEEFKRFIEKTNASKDGHTPNFSDYKEFKIKEDNIGFKMLQKLGWSQGQGLGSNGCGIVEPVNKSTVGEHNQGLGLNSELEDDEDEYEAYRKRMMLAYRFRPNPLNNPRRPYY